jgi:NADH-quinone oxidoreductase subunit J
MHLITFYILAVWAVISALLVITRKNPIYSALWLVSTLFSVAGIYLLLHAEFLAAMQILLYAGGIVVLFLFVIMLVGGEPRLEKRFLRSQLYFAIPLGIVILGEVLVIIYRSMESINKEVTPLSRVGHTASLGQTLFTDFLFPFEVISVILLVALIGATVISRRD